MSSRLFGIILARWWLRGDSNPRHTGYEPVALTNWATQPFDGGTYRARTDDPLLAKQVLSQLS